MNNNLCLVSDARSIEAIRRRKKPKHDDFIFWWIASIIHSRKKRRTFSFSSLFFHIIQFDYLDFLMKKTVQNESHAMIRDKGTCFNTRRIFFCRAIRSYFSLFFYIWQEKKRRVWLVFMVIFDILETVEYDIELRFPETLRRKREIDLVREKKSSYHSGVRKWIPAWIHLSYISCRCVKYSFSQRTRRVIPVCRREK